MSKEHENPDFPDEEYKRAVEKAMSLLLVQDRTEKALYERMSRAGFTQEQVAYAVAYVKGYGYVDDFRYAENYLAYRKGTKSKKELSYKLLQKGVPQQILREVLESYEHGEEQRALQNQLSKKLNGAKLSEMDFKEKEKIRAHLIRKGYGSSDVRQIMSETEQREHE